MPYRQLMGAFSQLNVLFPDNFSLCQIGKQTKTPQKQNRNLLELAESGSWEHRSEQKPGSILGSYSVVRTSWWAPFSSSVTPTAHTANIGSEWLKNTEQQTLALICSTHCTHCKHWIRMTEAHSRHWPSLICSAHCTHCRHWIRMTEAHRTADTDPHLSAVPTAHTADTGSEWLKHTEQQTLARLSLQRCTMGHKKPEAFE